MTRKLIAGLVLLVLGGAIVAAPASAAEAEPSIIAQAWYWEPQQNNTVDTPVGTVAGEAPNPFCPGVPGGLGAGAAETCAEGRLPVEVVQGDYETPDKVSAIALDLTMVTEGSKISSFTLTMLEAETGCYPHPDSNTKQQCEETDARNVDGKRIQACEATEIFGDGEARQYKEMPKFNCDDAVVGTRKEIKNDAKTDPNDQDPDHVWTFDLTPLATKWAETPPLCTCVMFRPLKPKKAEDDDANWRVVFAGPKFPKGVGTSLQFTPGSGGGLPPITPPITGGTGIDTGTTGSTSSFGGTDVGGGLDTGTTDTGTTDTGTTDTGDPAATDEPVAATDDAAAAGATAPKVETMPGYVWLALLAGLIGFSMVRSVVLEKVHGQRPNGVLAQIHRINTARGGLHGAAAISGDGAFSGLKSGFSSIGQAVKPLTDKFSSLAGKLPGIKKG